jgi:transposase-like protein
MTRFPATDPFLAEAVRVIGRRANSLAAVARRSGVSASTLYAWRAGKTKRPQHLTLRFALRACGYDLQRVERAR